MKKKHLGIDKGLTNYGDKEFSNFEFSLMIYTHPVKLY